MDLNFYLLYYRYDHEVLNNLQFVLTKTAFEKQNPSKWGFKYVQWWAQACTVKVNDIYLGIKSKASNGHMCVNERIRHLDVNKIAEVIIIN